MYPDIDEALYTLLSNSTKPTLKQVKTYYIGNPKLQITGFSIEIAQNGDKLNSETFDDEERLVNYDIVVHLKKLKYLEAQQLIRDLVRDIKEEVHSEKFTRNNVDYSDMVTVGDILPIYNDKGVLRTALVQLLFHIDEAYYEALDTFDTVQIRGELRDDEE